MASAPALDAGTAETLRQAIGMAQSGDLNRAYSIAQQGLLGGGDAVALHAFLGMIKARQGDPAAAAGTTSQPLYVAEIKIYPRAVTGRFATWRWTATPPNCRRSKAVPGTRCSTPAPSCRATCAPARSPR